MRVFKNNWFTRYARTQGIGDDVLCRAARDADRGLVDADLGGGVIKQRVARPGQGKSGGFRTIILFRVGMIAVFAYGFAKNVRDNIKTDELTAFRQLASEILAYDEAQLALATAGGSLIEVECNDEEIQE